MCARAGVELRPGDIVLVRTGWWRLFGQGAAARERYFASEPGPSGACGRWFHDHDFVALGADNPGRRGGAVAWNEPIPVHREIIWGCGGYLLEFLDLEALAADRVYEFMFVATPLAPRRRRWQPDRAAGDCLNARDGHSVAGGPQKSSITRARMRVNVTSDDRLIHSSVACAPAPSGPK